MVTQVERPYGLATVPESGRFELGSPQNEAAVAARWRVKLEEHGAEILGIRDVPSKTVRFELRGIEWTLERMTERTYQVPATVYHRIQALEAVGVPFAYWLWGEEQFPTPTFTPAPAPVAAATERKRDPLIIGVIPTAADRGVWVLCGMWLH